MSTQSIILAAGKGTRLAPITNTRSKGMLPILGKPFLERIIRGMLSSGLRNFILVVNPEDHEIREYFQKEFSLDVQIQFIAQDRQLGTAHALRLAAPHITGDFFLSACDSLVPEGEMNLLVSTWSRYPGSQGLLSLERIPQKDADKTGIVTLEGDKVSGIVEKPLPAEAPSNISSTPLYAFSSRILDYLSQLPISPRGEYELQGAIQMMIDEGQTVNGIFLKTLPLQIHPSVNCLSYSPLEMLRYCSMSENFTFPYICRLLISQWVARLSTSVKVLSSPLSMFFHRWN